MDAAATPLLAPCTPPCTELAFVEKEVAGLKTEMEAQKRESRAFDVRISKVELRIAIAAGVGTLGGTALATAAVQLLFHLKG